VDILFLTKLTQQVFVEKVEKKFRWDEKK